MKYLLLSLLILLTSCNVFEKLGEKTDIDPTFFRGNNDKIEEDDKDNTEQNDTNSNSETITQENVDSDPTVNDPYNGTTETIEPSYINIIDINLELNTILPSYSRSQVVIKNISSSELFIHTSFIMNEGNIMELFNNCSESFLAVGGSCFIDLETYSSTIQNSDSMILEIQSPTDGFKTETFNIKVNDPIQ